MENAIDTNQGCFEIDISFFLVQNIKMPPYALKTTLKLLQFYIKILQKIHYFFTHQIIDKMWPF